MKFWTFHFFIIGGQMSHSASALDFNVLNCMVFEWQKHLKQLMPKLIAQLKDSTEDIKQWQQPYNPFYCMDV